MAPVSRIPTLRNDASLRKDSDPESIIPAGCVHDKTQMFTEPDRSSLSTPLPNAITLDKSRFLKPALFKRKNGADDKYSKRRDSKISPPNVPQRLRRHSCTDQLDQTL